MANRVIKETYVNRKEILKYNEFIACPVTVSDANVAANADGKKIVKAGTVIGGSSKKVLENPGEAVVDKVTPAIKATKTIGTTTSGIIYTANVAGKGGNSISIKLVDPGQAGELGVVVTGTDIVVNLEYEGSALTSTALEVVEAINADKDASALITAAPLTTGEGVAAAATKTSLAGGADIAVANYAEGVLLYDVDVTNGPREGSMVIWGFIDLAKVDPVDSTVMTALPKITYLY